MAKLCNELDRQQKKIQQQKEMIARLQASVEGLKKGKFVKTTFQPEEDTTESTSPEKENNLEISC